MANKLIKVDEENYKWILRESAALQYNSEKKVSLNDALTKIRESKQASIFNFGKKWNMTDKEAKDFLKKVRSDEHWR